MSAAPKQAVTLETAPTQASSEVGALMAIVAQAARDPNTDVEKMKGVLDMIRELRAADAEVAFNAAMMRAQGEMQPIAADAVNPQTRSKYASYVALDRAIRPIYTRHGFALSFDEGDSPKPEHVRVLCYVSHIGGHTRTYHRDIPADGKGAKGGDVMTKTHAAGAAGTYGARYLLRGIFNIAVGEIDDDGNSAAAASAPIIPEQVEALRAEIVETGADLAAFLRYFRVERLEDLPASQFERARAALGKKRAAK
jgi:hypothetical protein